MINKIRHKCGHYTYHMLSNVEKEKIVIDLYYNQRKNVRQIAQEARISFRDIAAVLKKKEAASCQW